ncbi:unnamed protein product, partial [Ectocarpus fasciculatus]
TSATCEACPSGRYCYGNGQSVGATCPEGFYCPTGTDDYRSFPCPAGTFSADQGLYSAAQCLNCTSGNYCPAGSSSVSSCPSGTYLPYAGGQSPSSCLPCEPGYACPSTGMTAMTTVCAAGHYCPGGTSFATEYPCPAGTYSDAIGLASRSGCLPCPEGHMCHAGTTSGTLDSCTPGYYCPTGTAYGSEVECPAGSYSNRTSLQSADDCTPCPPGFYCVGGKFSLSGPCAAGYYCPPSSSLPHANACPAGTYSNRTDLFDAAECLVCPRGSFCPSHSTEPVPCPDGTYGVITGAVTGNTSESKSCQECPGGTRCPAGSTEITSCGVGYYSRNGDSTCLVCEAGHYCGKNTTSYVDMISGGGSWDNSGDLAGVCFNGTYCDVGMTRPPDLLRDSCPRGSYCPMGTEYPAPCPAGRYGLSSGLGSPDECTITPAGFYSVEGALNTTGLCDPGYYCPPGSTGPQQIPCPPRHYRPEFGGGDIADCSLCVAGTYGASFGLRRSEECTLCGAGTYCDGYGLTEFRGLCSPGFYCISGVNTSTPYALAIRNDTGVGFGDICPVGHYCPLGSGLPTPCPSGRYNGQHGKVRESDCVLCSPGYYCAGLANVKPTGTCEIGYYCPAGSISSREYEAPLGGYTDIRGSSNYTECVPGFYQSMYAQDSCIQCPEGYYCPNNAMMTFQHTLCPAGYFCPLQSQTPERCPIGTYSSQTGLHSSAQCSDCTPGYYCNSSGLVSVTGPCDAGYYCTLAAEQKTHDSFADSTGGVCPVGHYCPRGTVAPIKCPKGTFMSSTNAAGDIFYNDMQFYCDLCSPGYSCPLRGMTASGATPCEAGYFCRYGSPSATPFCEDQFCEDMYGACPVGHFCGQQTDVPSPCEDGTYMDDTGATVCKQCPIGYYCAKHISTSNFTDCPQGYYCPAGTGPSWEPCPVGKYGASSKLQYEDDCSACPAGMYCADAALKSPTGQCSAGFFCPPGSMNSWGLTVYTGNNSCPTGSYCPAGAQVPLGCPPGTYNPHRGISDISDCIDCPPGHFCAEYNLSSVSGVCDAGFYCEAGAKVPNPLRNKTALNCYDDPHGDVCPPASFCPPGTAHPFPCEAGTYNDLFEQASCFNCPAGYYCPGNTSEYFACPVGHYCPSGTKYRNERPCPEGTYNNDTTRGSLSDCHPAPPGYYISGTGNTEPDGYCLHGFYCPSGAINPTPFCNSSICETGGRCTPGMLCPNVTGYPLPCPGGQYCANYNGLVTGFCAEGYYCHEGSTSRTPVAVPGWTRSIGADVCPPGHFCPYASEDPQDCPPGTYSFSTGNTNISDCMTCTAGHYCPNASTVAPMECPIGYYCPIGTVYYNLICDEGYYCPAGSATQTKCSEGTYQPEIGEGVCLSCPEGHYCTYGTATPLLCPPGFICPLNTGSAHQFPCPMGTYNNNSGAFLNSSCQSCLPGQHCATNGLSWPTGPCAAGYFCGGGSSVANPHASDPF